MVTMITTKISQSYFRCVKLFIHKISCRTSSTNGNIRDWLLLNCVSIISDVTQSIVLQFCKTFKKTTFSVFLSFFVIKLSKSLKLNISRTAWPILMILVSFCRILNGLSYEINLFWRRSSPLTAHSFVNKSVMY